jgi:ATP synthase protein I
MTGTAPAPRGSSGRPAQPDDARFSNGGYNAGMAVFSYIIGGILVWSLIGWGLDNLLDTRWLVLAGAFLGAAGGFYLSHMHNLTRNHTPHPHDGARSTDGDEVAPE